MIDVICQIAIGILGCTSLLLVSMKKRTVKRWGFLLGLCGQPFWYITTYTNEQWGIFSLCTVYTISWINGLRNHWREPDEHEWHKEEA